MNSLGFSVHVINSKLMALPYKKLKSKKNKNLNGKKGLKYPLVLQKARKQRLRFLTPVKTKDSGKSRKGLIPSFG